jgi:hypothetical protein
VQVGEVPGELLLVPAALLSTCAGGRAVLADVELLLLEAPEGAAAGSAALGGDFLKPELLELAFGLGFAIVMLTPGLGLVGVGVFCLVEEPGAFLPEWSVVE